MKICILTRRPLSTRTPLLCLASARRTDGDSWFKNERRVLAIRSRIVGEQEVMGRNRVCRDYVWMPRDSPQEQCREAWFDSRAGSDPAVDQRVPTVWDRPHGKRPLAIHVGAAEQSCVRRGGAWQGELKSCAAPGDTGGPQVTAMRLDD